jgi:RNA polymerase sigma factor (sigma-70 family)
VQNLVEVAGRDLIGNRDDPDRLAELGRWYIAEHDRLLRFAIVVCGDRYTAEDLVQEAFVRSCLAGADPSGAIGAYVRRAIVNLSRSAWRRRSNERLALSRLGTNQPTADPDGESAIWSAILELSPQQRAVVALRYYEDLSEAEIGRTLGISPGNVKKHADRARKRLRELLEREVTDDLR